MYMKEAVVLNQVGLHARPATFLIQKANEFKSSIWIEKGDRRVNAKSLLGVLSLGVAKGTEINIIADGSDEEEASTPLQSDFLRFCRVKLESKSGSVSVL
jgi:phosphocarrier protein